MKNLTTVGLIAALAAGVCFSGVAQENKGKGKGPMMSVEQRLERMDKELKLTADQKTKIKAEMEKAAKARQEMMQDSSLTREQRREKGQALMEKQNKEFKTILTPEQFEKWEKMRQEMRERRPQGVEEGKKVEKKKE